MSGGLGAISFIALLGCRPAEVADLWLGGDVHLGDGVPRALEPLGRVLEGAHGIVNLTGPAAEVGGNHPAQLSTQWNQLSVLRAAGIRVIGIVNGHSGDLGDDALGDTARAIRRDGMFPAGGPVGAAIIESGGLRIVVTAHDLTGEFPTSLDTDLLAAAAMGDVLVTTFHAGSWFAPHRAAPELQRAANIAIASGARVVASHGTHQVAGVERSGRAVIAWGLGNLVFASDCTRERMGAILRVWVPRRGRVRAAVIPVDAGLGGSPARPAADPEATFRLLRLLGTKLRSEGPFGWVE